MSSPPVRYQRYFDFTTYASQNPDKPLPGGSVDVEYNRIKTTTDQIIDRLALIQRSDGALADNIINTNSIADGAITTPKLADQAVTTPKIADGAVTGPKIQPGSLNGAALAPGSIGTTQLADNSVTTAKIQDAAITSAKLAPGAVGPAAIPDGSLTLAKLAPNSVDASKIVDGSVGTAELADGAITSAKLAPGAVTAAAIPDGSITSAKIADGTIAPADLSSSTLSLITSAGNPRGAWAPGTAYATKDSVTNGSGIYVCLVAHTSGSDFATDLAAGKWMQTGSVWDQSLNKADAVQFSSVAIVNSYNGDTNFRLQNYDPGAAARMFGVWDNGATQFVFSHPGANYLGGNFFNQPNVSAIYSSGSSLRLGTLNSAPIIFGTATAERARINDYGLSILGGVTSASIPLAIIAPGNGETKISLKNADPGVNANCKFFADNGTNSAAFGVLGEGFASSGGFVAGGGFISTTKTLGIASVGGMYFGANGSTVQMRLDVNGRLGIGRVPETTWPSAGNNWFNIIALGGFGTIGANHGYSANIDVSCNLYYDGTNWRAIGDPNGASGYPMMARQDASSGLFQWYMAPITAGGTVAGIAEVARLDSTSNFSINARSSAGNFYAHGNGPQLLLDGYGVQTTLDLDGSITTPNNGNGIRMKCISGGVVLSNGATSWVSTSARASKKDIVPLPDGAVERIAKMPKVLFRYKEDAPTRRLRCGTMYEEALEVMPYITEHRPAQTMRDENGNTREVEELKGVSLESIVPDLMKAIDELDARLRKGRL